MARIMLQPHSLLCIAFVAVCNVPSVVPELVESSSSRGVAAEGANRMPCFVPSLAIHRGTTPLFSCPSSADRVPLALLRAPSAFRAGQDISLFRQRRVQRRLGDKDKQDKPQEDKPQDEKDKEDDREVFWMFEKEKKHREELKAPTLLRVELDNYNVEGLVKWVQNYPYAAVLPVQPLMMEPKEDGVDVLFRKKPTKERGSIDGGLRVKVEEVTSITWDPHRWPQASRNKEERVYSEAVGAAGTGRQAGAEKEDPQRCTVMVSRIAEGQMVEKKFSEKLVVQRMLKEMRSEEFEHGRVISSFANDLSMPQGPKFPDPK